jgi:hypothetical protein
MVYSLECDETLAGATCHHSRVVVLADGSWGTLCELGLDIERAWNIICAQLGFDFGELHTYGSARSLPDCPVSTVSLGFRDSDMDDFCTSDMDMGAVCYNGNPNSTSATQNWVAANRCSPTSMADEVSLPGQTIVFGCLSLTTVRCSANETLGNTVQAGAAQVKKYAKSVQKLVQL